MNRITDTIRRLRSRDESAFMPFVVIGDPDLETSLRLADALVEAGADILEFGMPFSDPPADGPVIQRADVRSLAAGTTPPLAFSFLGEVTRRHDIPVALLMYYNLVMQYGVQAFYARAAECGVDAILVADVPLEASDGLVAAARTTGIAPVFIASELTSPQRLDMIAQRAEGFLSAVARVGITGEQQLINPALPALLDRLRARVPLPILAGFGISTPEQAMAALAAGADGVICGSAVIRRIADHLGDPNAMIAAVREFAAGMKRATRQDAPDASNADGSLSC